MKPPRNQLSVLLSACLLVLLGTAWVVFAPTQFGGQATYVVVNGNSMEPALHYGDLVILRTASHYQVGEIVTYHYPAIGPVIHRIIGRDGERFIFKGDNNFWVDSYRPTSEQLLGAFWIRLPALGRLVGLLRTPPMFALLAFVIGITIMASTLPNHAQRLRRRKTDWVRHAASDAALDTNQVATPTRQARPNRIDTNKEAALLALAVITFTALLLALVAFTLPLVRQTSEDVGYTQAGNFSYSATAPGGVYDSDHAQAGEPIFRKLSSEVALHFDYQVLTEAATTLHGSYQLVAEIGDESGWKRSIQLTPATDFSGERFTAKGTLKLAEVQALLDTKQQQTGIEREYYTLAIVPQVALAGTLAEQPLQEQFAPRLEFRLDALQLQLVRDTLHETDPLAPRQSGMLKRSYSEPNTISLFGLRLAVATARWLPLIGVVIAAAGALLLGSRMALTTRRDEATRIQFKYGPLLIAVHAEDIPPGERLVEVATIDDLVKLAERDERVILWQQHDAAHHYFVQSAGLTYRYRIAPTTNTAQPLAEAGTL